MFTKIILVRLLSLLLLRLDKFQTVIIKKKFKNTNKYFVSIKFLVTYIYKIDVKKVLRNFFVLKLARYFFILLYAIKLLKDIKTDRKL